MLTLHDKIDVENVSIRSTLHYNVVCFKTSSDLKIILISICNSI